MSVSTSEHTVSPKEENDPIVGSSLNRIVPTIPVTANGSQTIHVSDQDNTNYSDSAAAAAAAAAIATAHIAAETVAATAAITAAIAAATAKATADIAAKTAATTTSAVANVVDSALTATDHRLCGEHTSSILALIGDDQRHQNDINHLWSTSKEINESLQRVSASLDRMQANDEEDHRKVGILWDQSNKCEGKSTNSKAVAGWFSSVIGWLVGLAYFLYTIFHRP